jgi:hypothetical protein
MTITIAHYGSSRQIYGWIHALLSNRGVVAQSLVHSELSCLAISQQSSYKEQNWLAVAPLKPSDTVWSKSKPHRKGAIIAAAIGGKKH